MTDTSRPVNAKYTDFVAAWYRSLLPPLRPASRFKIARYCSILLATDQGHGIKGPHPLAARGFAHRVRPSQEPQRGSAPPRTSAVHDRYDAHLGVRRGPSFIWGNLERPTGRI